MADGTKFRVVLVGGQFKDMISGHDIRQEADARAKKANEDAESLGIAARYEVREKPAPEPVPEVEPVVVAAE